MYNNLEEYEQQKVDKFDRVLMYGSNNQEIYADDIITKKPDINFNEIIITQDILDGNWTENNQTKLLIEKEKKIYDKIEILSKKRKINNKNAIITLFILYYIQTCKKEKTEELKFIINKAKNYIKDNYKLEFEKIIKEINY